MIDYKIIQADFSKISKRRMYFLIENKYSIYFKYNLEKYSNKKYLFWNKVKFLDLPEELESHEELWYIIKEMRIFSGSTPIWTEGWKRFKFSKPDFLDELLHILDLSLWWSFLDINFNASERRSFVQNGIIEEAISSSQLEWALTSSKVAKEMIWKWRKAVTKDEKMILNNYQAMNFVNDEEFLKEDITLESLLEIQSILTKDTLDKNDQEWRLRKDSDEIVIQNGEWTKILHTPPSYNFLKEELSNLLDYANDKDGVFTHPFIKAIILHFWIWYLHPFCDWNWRTARTIFYWYLLRKGYWGFSYIPISTAIKNSRKQYWNAYIYSEQDNYDFTYFLVYIANKTNQSFSEFKNYIQIKRKEQKSMFLELNHLFLNERQNKLLIYLLKNNWAYTNNSIHKNYYRISINTAKKDLEELLQRWFLFKRRQWKYVNYFWVTDLEKLIEK